MGCYDMITATLVCPYCNKTERIVLDQTKAGSCTFEDLGLGDRLDGFYEDFNYTDNNHKCESCGNEYSYKVKVGNEQMYSIEIIDKIFNKKYIYKTKEECKPKKIDEKDIKEMVRLNNRYDEILAHNKNKIIELQEINKQIENKQKIIKYKIEKNVYKALAEKS